MTMALSFVEVYRQVEDRRLFQLMIVIGQKLYLQVSTVYTYGAQCVLIPVLVSLVI